MGNAPAETGDPGDDDDLPRDLIVLLTPPSDIYRRTDPEEFITFAVAVDRAVDAHFGRPPGRERLAARVACALVPGRPKVLTEIQLDPPDAAFELAERLARAIDRLPLPAVTDGPVAFFRQGVFGGGAGPAGAFVLPFLRLVRGPGAVLLDDVLMAAGGGSVPRRTLWAKVTGLGRGRRTPARDMATEDIIPRLARELGRPVVAGDGRVGVERY